MTIQGLDLLARRLDALRNAVRADQARAIHAGADVLAEAAAERADGRGGEIAPRIAGADRAEVAADGPGAFIHEFGGTILPVTTEYLHFTVDGAEIFTHEVNMPARPYMRPAIDDTRAEIARAVTDVLRDTIGDAV